MAYCTSGRNNTYSKGPGTAAHVAMFQLNETWAIGMVYVCGDWCVLIVKSSATSKEMISGSRTSQTIAVEYTLCVESSNRLQLWNR